MIDLGTLAGLYRHKHQLAAYCQACDRWAVLNLAAMVAAGHGDRRLPIRVRCSSFRSAKQPQSTLLSPGRRPAQSKG